MLFRSELAHRATSVLAMEVAKQRAVTEVQLRVQGDLVEDLLAGTFPSEDAAIFRARALGYDLTIPHMLLASTSRQYWKRVATSGGRSD